MRTKSLSANHKNLIRRYLIWAYKSAKESFDRLERKTTQLLADEYILRSLTKQKLPKNVPPGYDALVAEYKLYVAKKKELDVDPVNYLYLSRRLLAIEATIRFYLGAKALKDIQAAYELEFSRRIWESKEH